MAVEKSYAVKNHGIANRIVYIVISVVKLRFETLLLKIYPIHLSRLYRNERSINYQSILPLHTYEYIVYFVV